MNDRKYAHSPRRCVIRWRVPDGESLARIRFPRAPRAQVAEREDSAGLRMQSPAGSKRRSPLRSASGRAHVPYQWWRRSRSDVAGTHDASPRLVQPRPRPLPQKQHGSRSRVGWIWLRTVEALSPGVRKSFSNIFRAALSGTASMEGLGTGQVPTQDCKGGSSS
jgi:hypothetical protein